MCVNPAQAFAFAAGGLKVMGDVAANMAGVNADRYNAQAARNEGYTNESIARHESRLKMANQLAALSARGAAINSGSPLAVQAESARNAELNDLQIRANASNKAAGYDYKASVSNQLLPYSIAGDILGSASKLQSLGKLDGAGGAPQGKV